MAMKALRDASSGGLGKFILFGFLGLAVAGLALTDISGQISGGTGSNNVLKVAGETVSIQEFDRSFRAQLQRTGLSTQDAYKMGFANPVISGHIRDILLTKQAEKLGISADRAQVAAYTNKLLEPFTPEGESKAQVLQQILHNQRMTEKQFEASIQTEIASNLITSSAAAGGIQYSEALSDALYQFYNETRAIEYVKYLNSEIKPKAPSAQDLEDLYNRTREFYKTPQTRAVEILLLDDSKITADTNLDASAILEKKFELVEQLEDLAASDISADEIAKNLPIKIVKIDALTAMGEQLETPAKLPDPLKTNLPALAEEAFALEEGETSMAIELPGAKFATVKLDTVTPESYKDFATIKSDLIVSHRESKQQEETLARAQKAQKQLQDSGEAISKFASANTRKLRTLSALKRSEPKDILTISALATIFNAQKSDVVTLPIEGGQIVAKIKDISWPTITDKTRESEPYKAHLTKINTESKNETIETLLQSRHDKSPAKINEALLSRVYGQDQQ